MTSTNFALDTQEDKGKTKLTVASSNNFPPINMLDASGQLHGFGHDISSAVANELGIKLTYKHSHNWPQVLDWLQQGKVDFIHDTGYTTERDRFLDYTQPILVMNESIFVRHDHFYIHDLESLSGKKVACVNKHITHLYLQRFPAIKCHVVSTPAAGLADLINGDVDAFIYPEQIVMYLAQKLNFTNHIKIVGKPLRKLSWSMTVKQGNTAVLDLLNTGISNIKNNGIYQKIYDKWFGKKVLSGYSTTEVFYIVFSATLITALLVFSIGLTLYLRKIKKANHSLSESENKYRTLVDNLPQSVFLKDRDSVYISCNQNYADSLGISPQDIVGKTDYDFHKEQADEYRQGDRDVLALGKTSNFIETYIKNGKKGVIHTVKTPIHNKSGNISGVLGIFWDITETHQLQQKLAATIHEYNAITDTVSDIIYKLDMDGNITWWNKQFEKVTGFKLSEYKKIHFREIISEDEYASLQSAIDQTYADGYAQIEFSLLTTEGKVPYLCNGAVLKNDSGDIIGLAGVGRDIRKQKQQELDRQTLFRQLQQAQKMEAIGHLTGGIAHDFNNLLAVILGNSELALDYYENKEDQKLTEYLTEIITAGERGQKLITQMLAFSSSKKVENQTIQLEPCLKEDIKLISSILPSSIQVNTEIEANLPAVQMNRTQLNQVIMNLAINARDAMNGQGTLTIQLGWLRDLNTECVVSLQTILGDWQALSVIDTGSGIDPTIIKQIFNPFYTTKEVGKGSGMGLPVIYGIMRDHGGHILLETEQGKGTTFRLLFPAIIGNTKKKYEVS